MSKANQFAQVADMARALADEADDIADAYVTLAVHAGIAAADVICCARLGEHAQGQDHHDAVALLKRANPTAARHLDTLLGLKTQAGYSHSPVSTTDVVRAERALRALMETARAA